MINGMVTSYVVTALSEAPASRGDEVVPGRHLQLSGAGSKPPAAPSLKTIYFVPAPSTFGCFSFFLTILPPREEACRQLQLFTYRHRPKRSCLNQSTDLTVGVR